MSRLTRGRAKRARWPKFLIMRVPVSSHSKQGGEPSFVSLQVPVPSPFLLNHYADEFQFLTNKFIPNPILYASAYINALSFDLLCSTSLTN